MIDKEKGKRALFAIPGDKDRLTGGFIYDATVLRTLNELGCPTGHLVLPDSFPMPTPDDVAATFNLLRRVPAECPIIIDGLVLGALDPSQLADVQAPIIAMIHHPLGLETGLRQDQAAFLCANEAAALRYADQVIVPSAHTAALLARDFGVEPSKTTIALPGFIRPAVARMPCDPPLILSVGLLAERKGHDTLIAALALIQDVAWQAEIVGRDHDNVTASKLARQVADLGLSDRIHFAGELSDVTLNDRYNAASIFALATRYEGYGMVLSEAMQYRLPIVSCAVGAVSDTVGDAGMLVPPDDPARFADALRQLLTDPALARRMSAASGERAASLPTWEDTARVFVAVINRLDA